MAKQTTQLASVRKSSKKVNGKKTSRFNILQNGRLNKKVILLFVVVLFAGLGGAYTYFSSASIAAYTPVYFIKTKNTANCKVEVHRATAASDYSKVDIQSATWFDACKDGDNGTWQMVGEDLYFIKTKNTGGTIEIHSATKASGYKSGIHSTTAIGVADGANGTFQMVGEDLYFIKTKNTGGTIEIHAVNRGSNYQSFSMHSATAFSTADAANGVWRMYNTDLALVKTKNTAGGKVELHIATRGSNYRQFSLHTSTFFSVNDRDNGQFWVVDSNADGKPDLGFVKKQSTGTGKVEAFFAQASNYNSLAVAVPTWFSPKDANNGVWYMSNDAVKPAASRYSGTPGTATNKPKKATYTCVGTTTKEVDSRDVCLAILNYAYAGHPDIVARQIAASDAANAGAAPTFTPIPAAPAAPTATGTPTLQAGATGAAVSELQQRLANRGFWIAATGNFDQATLVTVKSFQKVRDISADGIVGPQTYGQLASAEAEGWTFNPNDPRLADPRSAIQAVGVVVDRVTNQNPLAMPTAEAINEFFAALRMAELVAQNQQAARAAEAAARAARGAGGGVGRAVGQQAAQQAQQAADSLAKQVRAAQVAQNLRNVASRVPVCETPDWEPGDLIIVNGCTPGW